MKNAMKTIIGLLSAIIVAACAFLPASAKQVVINENSESTIMLDVARRYYPVSEIKQYIDALAVNENSSIQIHFTDDQNVGIECEYLNQTADNATKNGDVYTNPTTGRNFLTYAQVQELMDYADAKHVTFVPEIDIPAHMNGFFDLAIAKYGEPYVRDRDTGIAWSSNPDESGNIDIVRSEARNFLFALYDEYTEFFKSREYFHIGFDEYTFRIDEKIAFANEMYDYLSAKGFKMRMWNDSVTRTNISQLNKNIEITYWGYWGDVVSGNVYATVPDFQREGFKLLLTNSYYLFFVPSTANMTESSKEEMIDDINNAWSLEQWNSRYTAGLESHDGILGGMLCIWGENSTGVVDAAIREQGVAMYNAMFPKLDVHQRIIDVPDDDTENPATFDDGIAGYLFMTIAALAVLVATKRR